MPAYGKPWNGHWGWTPAHAEAWHQYGSVLAQMGEDSASAAAFRRALEIDPQRAISWVELSFLSTIRHRYDESLILLDRAIAMAAGWEYPRFHRMLVELMLGDTAAVRRGSKLIRAAGWSDPATLIVARLAARSGDPESIAAARTEVLTLINDLTGTIPTDDADDIITMVIPALLDLGEKERALQLLESIHPRGRTLWFWLRWPSCDSLRTDSRFQRLVAEAGQ